MKTTATTATSSSSSSGAAAAAAARSKSKPYPSFNLKRVSKTRRNQHQIVIILFTMLRYLDPHLCKLY